MTLPRELKLMEYDVKPILACPVVKEIDNIAEAWKDAGSALDVSDAYQLRLTVKLDKNTTITLSNDQGEKYVIDVYGSSRLLATHRNASTGVTNFNGTFSVPAMQAPLNVGGETVTLDIFVDQSSVEILTNEGAMSMTNLVFPQGIYNRLSVAGADCEAKVRNLKSIWK